MDFDAMTTKLLTSLGDDTPPTVRAQIETFAEVGYIVTEETAHTFSHAELTAFEDCYRRRLQANGIETSDDQDDEDDDSPFDDTMEMVASALEICTAVTLAERTLE